MDEWFKLNEPTEEPRIQTLDVIHFSFVVDSFDKHHRATDKKICPVCLVLLSHYVIFQH